MAASDVSNIFVLARLSSLGLIVHGTQHGERERERERESLKRGHRLFGTKRHSRDCRFGFVVFFTNKFHV
jgi:hypothetical protein